MRHTPCFYDPHGQGSGYIQISTRFPSLWTACCTGTGNCKTVSDMFSVFMADCENNLRTFHQNNYSIDCDFQGKFTKQDWGLHQNISRGYRNIITKGHPTKHFMEIMETKDIQ